MGPSDYAHVFKCHTCTEKYMIYKAGNYLFANWFCGSEGHQHSLKCDHKLHLCFFACLPSCICAGRARLSLPRCRDNWLTRRAVWLHHRHWGAENKCNLHASLKLLQKGDTQHLISIFFQTEITRSALAWMKRSMERGEKNDLTLTDSQCLTETKN